MEQDAKDQIVKLEKRVRLLERKLKRCEENRRQIESTKDLSDSFHLKTIEEVKKSQEELSRTNHEKEVQLSELARARRAMLNIMQDLDLAKLEAEAATRSKSDFLANMSHEIRTPMNAVIGLNYLLLKTELTEKQQDYVEKMKLSAENLLSIINDILDFSKIEAGKLSIEVIEFDLNEVLDNLASLMAPKAHGKGLDLVYSWEPDLPRYFMGDPLRIGQILLNLVSNAVKFTETGEIEIRIDCERLEEKSARLDFQVRDTGIGLTQEQISNLFNAFSQADSSTTRKYGGTGLGLSICERLAELMGGSIGVESTFGEGSTFHVSLTVGVQTHKTSSRTLVPNELNGLNVLAAGNHETVQNMIGTLLTDSGLVVSTAIDNKSAIDVVRKGIDSGNTVGLVIIDPDKDGKVDLSLVENLHALQPNRTSKVILMVDYGQEELSSKAEALGVDAIIMKPVTHSSLFDSVVSVLSGRKPKQKSQLTRKFSINNGRPAGLLLVEDNEINQQVARELLEAADFVVEIASNGQEAVNAVKKEEYDLVLMDLQMPVMDGYEAVRQIRKSGMTELPIVAMTADAMSGVEEKVIDVGMNGYITKPIRPDRLFDSLLENIPNLESYDSEPTAAEDGDFSVFNTLLDYETALFRIGGDPEFYKTLLESFRNDFGSFREKLAAAEKESVEKAARLAHSLKGVAGNLGADTVHLAAKEVEKALLEGEIVENLGNRLEDIESWFIRFNEIYEIWKPADEPTVGETDNEIELTREDLENLTSLLNSNNPKAADEISRLKGALSAIDLRVAESMMESVKRYDFESALNLLSAISDKVNAHE